MAGLTRCISRHDQRKRALTPFLGFLRNRCRARQFVLPIDPRLNSFSPTSSRFGVSHMRLCLLGLSPSATLVSRASNRVVGLVLGLLGRQSIDPTNKILHLALMAFPLVQITCPNKNAIASIEPACFPHDVARCSWIHKSVSRLDILHGQKPIAHLQTRLT